MSGKRADGLRGRVFISYVREDSLRVDRLQHALDAAGIPVWRDTLDLWPGEDRGLEIRRAIQSGTLAFIACFSENSELNESGYHNHELLLAAEQMRERLPGPAWLIPVRFSECSIPDFSLGAGRMLDSLQHVDLFDSTWEYGISRIIGTVYRMLGGTPPSEAMHASASAEPPFRGDVMEKHPILYSTTTWLAYAIAEKYYKDEHYVWCTPFFSPRKSDGSNPTAPTSPPLSSPLEIYKSLAAEVADPDRPDRKIRENRAGILRGLNFNKQSGEISEQQEQEIFSIVDEAARSYFSPLVYVIPYSGVVGKVREPPPGDKAYPLSAEYIIDRLPRDRFDVIKLEDPDEG